MKIDENERPTAFQNQKTNYKNVVDSSLLTWNHSTNSLTLGTSCFPGQSLAGVTWLPVRYRTRLAW